MPVKFRSNNDFLFIPCNTISTSVTTKDFFAKAKKADSIAFLWKIILSFLAKSKSAVAWIHRLTTAHSLST